MVDLPGVNCNEFIKRYEQLLKSLWADPDLLSTKGFYFLHFYPPLSILAVQESNEKPTLPCPFTHSNVFIIGGITVNLIIETLKRYFRARFSSLSQFDQVLA